VAPAIFRALPQSLQAMLGSLVRRLALVYRRPRGAVTGGVPSFPFIAFASLPLPSQHFTEAPMFCTSSSKVPDTCHHRAPASQSRTWYDLILFLANNGPACLACMSLQQSTTARCLQLHNPVRPKWPQHSIAAAP
jgi:hypothetical protein